MGLWWVAGLNLAIAGYPSEPVSPRSAEARELVERARSRMARGNLRGAAASLRRARPLVEGLPEADRLRFDEARLHLLRGRPEAAMNTWDQALDGQDRAVIDGLLVGTSVERQARVAPLQRTTSLVVSAHLQHGIDAAELAMRTLLRRKGQQLDAEYDTLQLVRSRADQAGLDVIDELVTATNELAQLHGQLQRADDPAALLPQRATLRAQIDRLQRALAERSRPFAKVAEPVEVAALAEELPFRTVLVEYVVYQPWDPKTDQLGADRYAAYTLARDGGVVGVDLGLAADIDQRVRQLRAALIARQGVDRAQRGLRDAIWQPLSAVRDAEHVIVAGDGLLSHIPHGLLAEGAPLVTYLTSGREIPQLGVWSGRPTPPVVIFGVDYGPGAPWTPLPGTQREGELIAAEFPELRTISGADARESTVKALVSPQFLHIATHGFFEANLDPGVFAPQPVRGLDIEVGDEPVPIEAEWTRLTDSPALRSGLVLAGANNPSPTEDGVWTAAELTNQDLRGTKLVVLSACETGLGEVRNGDGVHGLRRALVLAGTQAQVLSLWKVDDDATEALMTALYRSLARGVPVAEALREAQRSVAERSRWSHPFFWAGFTLSGKWDAAL